MGGCGYGTRSFFFAQPMLFLILALARNALNFSFGQGRVCHWGNVVCEGDCKTTANFAHRCSLHDIQWDRYSRLWSFAKHQTQFSSPHFCHRWPHIAAKNTLFEFYRWATYPLLWLTLRSEDERWLPASVSRMQRHEQCFFRKKQLGLSGNSIPLGGFENFFELFLRLTFM